MLVTALAGMVLASGAQAVAPPANDIVVQGHRIVGEAQALNAVQAISTTSADLQIARFHDPVCPLAIGMPAAVASQVQRKIRSIAKDVGATVAPGKCTANVILIVADDSRAMLSDIRQNRREWLKGVSAAAFKALESMSGPVRAWTVTSLRNEDGQIATDDLSGAAETMQVRSASILKQTTRQQIDGAVILIDRAAANGRTVREIAGYVAMRALAVTRIPKSGEVSSILNLFTPGAADAPRRLTSFDRGYLKGLYAGDGRDDALTARTRIARTVAANSRID